MPCRLKKEEVVTLRVLAERGRSNCEIARTLGVSEGTVRYHLKRAEEGAEDGRADKPFEAAAFDRVIRQWIESHRERRRPVNVRELHEHLCYEWSYGGSYRSVLRYVRRYWPKPKMRTWRRVETPAGAQSQTDWGEYQGVDVGEGKQRLSAFIMVLSHSRMPAVVWSRKQDQLSWIECHNESYRRLSGVAAVNRIDNVKTAIMRGAGVWGVIHPVYRAYARAVGFHIDACSPGRAQEKGKVEAKVRFSRLRLDPCRRSWSSLEELQAWTDEQIGRWCHHSLCPATGKSVYDSWQMELERLARVAILPEAFDVAVTRFVHRDCLVHFEGRSYAVPFRYAGSCVEVRGCSGKVQILADGKVAKEYPRHSEERLLIAGDCYEGGDTETVRAPLPLGKMGRRLQEIYEQPVEQSVPGFVGGGAMTNKRKATVDLDATRQSLEQLGLMHSAEMLSELVNQAVKQNLTAHRFLDDLLAREQSHREERRIRTSLRLSGLPPGQTLGNFDFSFQPAVKKSQIETLATCQWIREHETVLLQGPPGVGKTHLAVSLGVKAIENGFSVSFFRLDDLLHTMKKDAELSPKSLRRKKYINVALLIVDEVGFQVMNRQEAGLFFRLGSSRYERGATLITTNKSVKDWPEILAGDEIMATALLDRLLHKCHVLNIKGRSYRLRDLETALTGAR